MEWKRRTLYNVFLLVVSSMVIATANMLHKGPNLAMVASPSSSSSLLSPLAHPQPRHHDKLLSLARLKGGRKRRASSIHYADASPLSVLFFVPNVIDYIRIGLAIACFHHAFSSWETFLKLYGASVGLDAIDGQVARILGQNSHLGVVLDQVIDRCVCVCVCVCW